MTTPEEHSDSTVRGHDQIQAAQRRRLLLARMGQGAAAASMLAPLTSRAHGTFRIPNTSLSGGYGYCSISGFQSAAISASTALPICSAFAPSHFVTTEALNYTANPPPAGNLGNLISGSINANKLASALNSHFNTGSLFNSTNVAPLLSSSQPSPDYVAVTGTGVVLYWTSGNTSTALTRRNWPDSALNGLALFPSIFTNSTDNRPLLRVLYDGMLSSSPTTANCWFLSAYLTVYSATPSTLPAGFNKTYLTTSYTGNGVAASGTDAYKFLGALCITG